MALYELEGQEGQGLLGGQLTPAAETFKVANIAPNSPGANAGLSRGDEIIELDGKPSAQFTLEEMRQAIRIDGKRMLTVAREGKRVKVVMELGGREVPTALAAGSPPRASRRPGA